MWINLNSLFYLDYSTFFKVPFLVNEKNLNLWELLYNTTIDKFFLCSEDNRELIYLDNSEQHNSYVSSYLINDYYGYKNKLKPYNSNPLCLLQNEGLNLFLDNFVYRNKYFSSLPSFQTEDEKYVVTYYDGSMIAKNFISGTFKKYLFVCEKVDFEDQFCFMPSRNALYNAEYITKNFKSNSNKVLFRGSVNTNYTNEINSRIDLDREGRNYELKNDNHFYIKNSPISDEYDYNRHTNVFPTWIRNGNSIDFVFDISKNSLPEGIPQTLTMAFDAWKLDLDFISTIYLYTIFSFEDDYSDKNNVKRYGFIDNRSSLYSHMLYKKYTTSEIIFVIEFSEELDGYKLFDLNNPDSGYFLCYDKNCLKDHTTYNFKAFLNKDIYLEKVFDYFKDNDLNISWRALENIVYNNYNFTNNAYWHCLQNVKKLLSIYNTQIPFIRF